MNLVDYETLVTTIACALVIAIGGSIWGAVKLFARRIASRDDQIAKLLQETEQLKKCIKKLEKRNDLQDKIIDDLIQSNTSILSDRLKQSCYAFIRKGSTNYLAKENILSMYKNYNNFGDDPGVKTAFYEYDKLPVQIGEIETIRMPNLKLDQETIQTKRQEIEREHTNSNIDNEE